jgi:hypothetical protein
MRLKPSLAGRSGRPCQIDARESAPITLKRKPNFLVSLFRQHLIGSLKWLFTGPVFTQNSILLRTSE